MYCIGLLSHIGKLIKWLKTILRKRERLVQVIYPKTASLD